MQVLLDEVMRDSAADSDGRFAVTRGIPRQRHPRINILVVGIDTRFPIKTWITGVGETRGRIRDHRAPLVSVKLA